MYSRKCRVLSLRLMWTLRLLCSSSMVVLGRLPWRRARSVAYCKSVTLFLLVLGMSTLTLLALLMLLVS